MFRKLQFSYMHMSMCYVLHTYIYVIHISPNFSHRLHLTHGNSVITPFPHLLNISDDSNLFVCGFASKLKDMMQCVAHLCVGILLGATAYHCVLGRLCARLGFFATWFLLADTIHKPKMPNKIKSERLQNYFVFFNFFLIFFLNSACMFMFFC